LLDQIPNDIPIFTKPSPLGVRHNLVKVPWPINYWVIDKDTHVRVSSTPVQSVSSLIGIININIASHWLPSATILTIVDPYEPEPLMKFSISIEYDSLRHDTNVLIDSAAILNFVSHYLFFQMVLWENVFVVQNLRFKLQTNSVFLRINLFHLQAF